MATRSGVLLVVVLGLLLFEHGLAQNLACDQFLPSPLFSFGNENYFGTCSNQGICVNGTDCVCGRYFSSMADFLGDVNNCIICLPLVSSLWALLALQQVATIWRSVPYVRTRYENYLSIKSSRNSHGMAYTIWDNKGLLVMAIWIFVGAPLVVFYSLLSILAPKQRVGVAFLPSFLFVMIKSTFFLCTSLFQTAFLRAVLDGALNRESRRIVRRNDRITGAMYLLQSGSGFFAIVAAAKESQEEKLDILLGYLMCMVIISLFLSLQGLYLKFRISLALDHSIALDPTNSHRIAFMKERVVQMQNVPLKQGLVLAVIYFSMFISPMLNVSHSYLLPITWFVFGNAYLNTAKTSLSSSDSSKIQQLATAESMKWITLATGETISSTVDSSSPAQNDFKWEEIVKSEGGTTYSI